MTLHLVLLIFEKCEHILGKKYFLKCLEILSSLHLLAIIVFHNDIFTVMSEKYIIQRRKTHPQKSNNKPNWETLTAKSSYPILSHFQLINKGSKKCKSTSFPSTLKKASNAYVYINPLPFILVVIPWGNIFFLYLIYFVKF